MLLGLGFVFLKKQRCTKGLFWEVKKDMGWFSTELINNGYQRSRQSTISAPALSFSTEAE
jgi:hypothetical protein